MNGESGARIFRGFFVDRDLWERARRKAAEQGIQNMSWVLRRLLKLYVEGKVSLL